MEMERLLASNEGAVVFA